MTHPPSKEPAPAEQAPAAPAPGTSGQVVLSVVCGSEKETGSRSRRRRSRHLAGDRPTPPQRQAARKLLADG